MTKAPPQSQQTEADKSDTELFNEAICNLKQAILQQSNSQRRVATRVKFLIRSIMVGLVSALVFISYLTYLIYHQVSVLTLSLDSISTETTVLHTNIEAIEGNIMRFETLLNDMPAISHSIGSINNHLSTVTESVSGTTSHITTIQKELHDLSGSLNGMSQNVQVLNQSVGRMNTDLNNVTKPVKRFNDFNPFN